MTICTAKLSQVRERVTAPRVCADQIDHDARYLLELLDEAMELVHQAQHGGWRAKADRLIKRTQE
jgi:hypothetical protein